MAMPDMEDEIENSGYTVQELRRAVEESRAEGGRRYSVKEVFDEAYRIFDREAQKALLKNAG